MKLTKKLLGVVALAAFASAASAQTFTLSSPDLRGGKLTNAHLLSEPYGFGCAGGNISPGLIWNNAPAGTKSFVLTLHDLDAPTGGLGWMHWVVVNIPANATGLPAGIAADGKQLPAGALQTRTDFGVPGYGGPCPPKGTTHRYEFTLTAVGVGKLPGVTADATPALVGFATQANALGTAKLTVAQGR